MVDSLIKLDLGRELTIGNPERYELNTAEYLSLYGGALNAFSV